MMFWKKKLLNEHNAEEEKSEVSKVELKKMVDNAVAETKKKEAGNTLAGIALLLAIVGIFVYPIVLIPLAMIFALLGFFTALVSGNMMGAIGNFIIGLIVGGEIYFFIYAVSRMHNAS